MTQKEQFYRDILCTAIEGGVNYWAECQKTTHDGDDYISVELRDAMDPEDPWHKVDLDNVRKAVLRIKNDMTLDIGDDIREDVTEAYRDNDAGYIDAADADCIVQIAAYGEIVFS